MQVSDDFQSAAMHAAEAAVALGHRYLHEQQSGRVSPEVNAAISEYYPDDCDSLPSPDQLARRLIQTGTEYLRHHRV